MRSFLHVGRPLPAVPIRQVGGFYDTYKEGSEAQEQVAVDLDIPVAKQWVELKRLIIEIADELGIGAEVSAVFDVLKAKAVGEVAIAAAGTSGGTIALGALGGVAAGVVGAVIIAAFSIFGGDEGETASKKRRDAMKAAIWRVLVKPGMAQLATEQDEQKQTAVVKASTAPVLHVDPAPYQKTAVIAGKLAAFYRLAAKTLSSSEQKLFLSAVWLSRLYALRDYAAGLSTGPMSGWGFYSAAQELSLAFPDFDQELDSRIGVAKAEFAALAKKKTTPKTVSNPGLTGGLIALGVGAGTLYYFKPALAARIAGGALSAGKSVVSTGLSGAKSVISSVKKVSP